MTGVQTKERGAGVVQRRQLARIETAPSAEHRKPGGCPHLFGPSVAGRWASRAGSFVVTFASGDPFDGVFEWDSRSNGLGRRGCGAVIPRFDNSRKDSVTDKRERWLPALPHARATPLSNDNRTFICSRRIQAPPPSPLCGSHSLQGRQNGICSCPFFTEVFIRHGHQQGVRGHPSLRAGVAGDCGSGNETIACWRSWASCPASVAVTEEEGGGVGKIVKHDLVPRKPLSSAETLS